MNHIDIKFCVATLSMDKVNGSGGVAVEERVNERKVKARPGSETILLSYKYRRGTAVRQEN